MHDTRKQRWLDEALAQIPADLTANGDGTTHREIMDAYLRPMIKRCKATNRSRFWAWLRLQLSKTEETAFYLMWMRESKLQLEIEKAEDGFRYVINGETALIEVTDGGDHVVWRVPVTKLEWALSMYPVSLKRLPDLEPPEKAQCRRLRLQLKKRLPFLTPEQRQVIENKIDQLRAMDQRAFAPVPRFMLLKYINGSQVAVHRLFVDAGPDDEVAAVDDDFTNFTTTTLVTTFEAKECPVVPYPAYQTETVVQNLQITNNAEAQKKFEDAFLQTKQTQQGDIDESPLRVQPNADFGRRTGIEGGLTADCGRFIPLSEEEITAVGLQGAAVRPVDEADAIRRRWRRPAPQWGNRWK